MHVVRQHEHDDATLGRLHAAAERELSRRLAAMPVEDTGVIPVDVPENSLPESLVKKVEEMALNEELLGGWDNLMALQGTGTVEQLTRFERPSNTEKIVEGLWAGTAIAADNTPYDPKAGVSDANPLNLLKVGNFATPSTQRATFFKALGLIEMAWYAQSKTTPEELNNMLMHPLGAGTWNTVDRVDWRAAVEAGVLEELGMYASPPEEIMKRFEGFGDSWPAANRGTTAVRRGSLAIRRAKFAQEGPTMRELLCEMALSAFASKVGVGPRQFFAFVVPAKPDVYPRSDVFTAANQSQSAHLDEVMFVSELWNGDCASKTGFPHDQPGFMRLLGRLFVRAACAGIFHGDIKRANLLYRIDQDVGKDVVALAFTDFDPYFVKLVDMSIEANRKMIPCLAILMCVCYLAEIRCQTRWGPGNVEAMYHILRRVVEEELKAAGEGEPLKGVPDDEGINSVCSLVTDANDLGFLRCGTKVKEGEPSVEEQNVRLEEKKTIYKALRSHYGNYSAKNQKTNVPCLPEGVRRPQRGPSMAQRIFYFVATGRDLWTEGKTSKAAKR